MAKRSGMMGSTYVTESRPKKTRQEQGSTRNTPLPLVTRLAKDTEGRVVNVLSDSTSRHKLSRVP